MKQVLFLKAAPGLPINGADISAFERILLLRQQDWNGQVISTGQIAHTEGFLKILQNLRLPHSFNSNEQIIHFSYADVEGRIYLAPDADAFTASDPEMIYKLFDQVISEEIPDALMGNVRDPVALSYLAGKPDIPTIAYLTEDEYPKKDDPASESFCSSLKKISSIVVASEYLQQSLKGEYNILPTRLTNTVATALYKEKKSSSGEFITMMHPYRHKGIELFIQLAQQMPEKQFLVMAGTGAEYREIKPRLLSVPNLTLAPHTKNAKEIYAKSHLVLVPSLWQEAFSRVIIEAYCCGTPVITSGSGGTKQTGGEAIVSVPVEVDTRNFFVTEPWKEAIARFDKQDYYKERAKLAEARVAEFEKELALSMSRLAKLLSGP